MRVTSFGKDFLSALTKTRASSRFAIATMTAAHHRWPEGVMIVEESSGIARWMVPTKDGLMCGILFDGNILNPPTLH